MNKDRYEIAHRMMLERLPWEQKQRIFPAMRHEAGSFTEQLRELCDNGGSATGQDFCPSCKS